MLLALLAPVAVLADSPDASFYKVAAEAGISEVDLGNMAQDKGSNQQVKDFGAMMVKDHSAANDKLKSLAASKSLTLPGSSSVRDTALKAKLDVLSGDNFDKAYIKSQLRAHRQAVALFKKESSAGQDADAKAFAAATLPTLRGHLKQITSIASAEGVSTQSK
jgi:putative membrane protein